MTSTVFELSLRVVVFTLTIVIVLPACAEEIPCNAETTCRIGKEKFIVKTVVTPSPYREPQKVEIRNRTSIKRLYDDMEKVTSESTSMAAHCSFEETAAMDLGALLDAGEGALVTLVAGETRLTAHRAVLAARGPIFAAMLCHGSQDASSGQVRIADVEGPVLRQLLANLYTLQAPQLPGMAPQMLAAADKFGLSALKSHCEAQVAAQLAVETAVATAMLAIRHSSARLTQEAIAFIGAHLVQVMATQGWADAVHRQPEDFIEVSRLLTKLPVGTSTQNASLGSTPAAADSQPTTEAQNSEGQTPATTASPSSACSTPPPADDAVSRLRSLSSEEKGRRLIEAAKVGSLEKVETLLAAGADVGRWRVMGGPPCTGQQRGDMWRWRGASWGVARRWTPGTNGRSRLCTALQTMATQLWRSCCWRPQLTPTPGINGEKRRCTGRQAVAAQRRWLRCWRREPSEKLGIMMAVPHWTSPGATTSSR